MSEGPAHSERKEQARPQAGINAALRMPESVQGGGGGEEPGSAAPRGAGGREGPGRRESPYVSRGLVQQKAEAVPPETERLGASALYRAHEAAYDPKADQDGFVNPSSFALGVVGASAVRGGQSSGPHGVPAGGPVSWAKRTGTPRAEVGPPPAHPLSVASPLGIGVAGGAWSPPGQSDEKAIGSGAAGLLEPTKNLSAAAGSSVGHGPPAGKGEGPVQLKEDAGDLSRGAGEPIRQGAAAMSKGDGMKAGAESAIANAWQGLWG